MRSMHPREPILIEPLVQVAKRSGHQVVATARVQAHVVAVGLQTHDMTCRQWENAAVT